MSGADTRPAGKSTEMPESGDFISQRKPIRDLHQEHVMRRRLGNRAQIAAEPEIAEALGLRTVLVPDHVKRRAGTKLPAHHRTAAHTSEVEVGILDRRRVRRVVAPARGIERTVRVKVPGGDEGLKI